MNTIIEKFKKIPLAVRIILAIVLASCILRLFGFGTDTGVKLHDGLLCNPSTYTFQVNGGTINITDLKIYEKSVKRENEQDMYDHSQFVNFNIYNNSDYEQDIDVICTFKDGAGNNIYGKTQHTNHYLYLKPHESKNVGDGSMIELYFVTENGELGSTKYPALAHEKAYNVVLEMQYDPYKVGRGK